MRGSASRRDVDHSRERVAAVDHTVGLPQDLDTIYAGDVERGKVEAAADVIRGHAVHEHFREIGIAAAQEQRRLTAALTDLRDLRAGDEAKGLRDIRLVDGLEQRVIDYGDRRTGLRLQYLSGFSSDDDVLLQRTHFENDFDGRTCAGPSVNRIRRA